MSYDNLLDKTDLKQKYNTSIVEFAVVVETEHQANNILERERVSWKIQLSVCC